jgi:hypothetical protein
VSVPWWSSKGGITMDRWPAWARWGTTCVTYALFGLSFWLMTRGAGLRLLGLACFAVSMPLMIFSGRALSGERTRAGDRRFVREFVPAMLIYMVLMLYVWPWQKGMAIGWPKIGLVLLPMLPIGWVILASIRHVLSSDELERRQHLEALAIAVSLVCVASLALGLLGAAGVLVPDGSLVLLLVYPAICLTYGVTRCAISWRTRRA